MLKRIPVSEYNRFGAVNYSTLKHVLKSPRHYLYASNTDSVPTEAMLLGTACHSAVLEPVKFATDYAVWTQQTKAGRSAPRNGKNWEAFLEINEGKTIITAKQYESAMVMQTAVRADTMSMSFLKEGKAEVAMVWTDRATGMMCKGRVDWVTTIDGETVIVGLKTAVESGVDAFSRQSSRLSYHLQWAMYREGYTTITGDVPRMIEIAVESKPPHDPVVYEIGPDVIDPGLAMYREALDEVARCRKTGCWPGQGGGEVVHLTLPSWAAGIPSDDDVELDMTGVEGSEVY